MSAAVPNLLGAVFIGAYANLLQMLKNVKTAML